MKHTLILVCGILLVTSGGWVLADEQQSQPDDSSTTVARTMGFQKTEVNVGRNESDNTNVQELPIEAAKPLPPAGSAKINSLISEIVEPETRMEVEIHRSKLIRTKVPITRFSITEPKTIDIVQYSPTEFELIGLKAGETTLTIWFGDKRSLRYLITVPPSKVPETQALREYRILQNKINELFPNSQVQLIPVADKLVVRGQARDSAEAAQILAMLSADEGADDPGVKGRAGRRLNVGKAVTPTPGGKGDLPAHDIINLLTVPGEQQIMLKVRVAQLDRAAARQMASKFRIDSGILAMNTMSGGISTVFSSVMTPQELTLALQAVSSSSYTKLLAEPNLVTLNGQPATFLAGGKFPVPTAVGIGGVSGINTQFQSFGTELTFTPTIIDKDRIRLEVSPSFSTVNKNLSVGGIPGTNNRAVTTTVDLRTGQWLAIAGLLQDNQKGTKTGVPIVGDIPLIGALFTKNSVSREETELIILVSPELVHPMDAQETPLILPGMEITEPSDAAFFLAGAYLAKFDGCESEEGACRQQSYEQPVDSVSSRKKATTTLTAERRRQVIEATMSRPDFQRSESYYIYGPHGLSE